MPELIPRDGAQMPPKRERFSADERALYNEIEAMSRSEAAAINTLAAASLRTADAVEAMADILDDLKAIMVKIAMHTRMPLPEGIKRAEYDPDEIIEDGDEEGAESA